MTQKRTIEDMGGDEVTEIDVQHSPKMLKLTKENMNPDTDSESDTEDEKEEDEEVPTLPGMQDEYKDEEILKVYQIMEDYHNTIDDIMDCEVKDELFNKLENGIMTEFGSCGFIQSKEVIGVMFSYLLDNQLELSWPSICSAYYKKDKFKNLADTEDEFHKLCKRYLNFAVVKYYEQQDDFFKGKYYDEEYHIDVEDINGYLKHKGLITAQ